METLFSHILLFAAVALTLFLPGLLLLRLVGRWCSFAALERFVLALPLSFVLVTFGTILLGWADIALTRGSILLSLAILCLCLYALGLLTNSKGVETAPKLFSFSKQHAIAILLILVLTVFVKTAYLTNTIFPTSTDLGHHTFWVEKIVKTGELPVYEKSKVLFKDGASGLSAPESIDDFIIGEHLVIADLALLAKQSIISAFPSLFLLLVNIFSLLTFFVLTVRLFAHGTQSVARAQTVGVLTLLLLGPLWAISGAQAKFVSGGVVGNLLGNLLIPATLYFVFRGLAEKNPVLLAIGAVIAFGLAYTHHLSAFMLLFILAASVAVFFALNITSLKEHLTQWAKLLLSPALLITLIACGLFFATIYTPNYIANSAVETSVGEPSKSTRTGLAVTQLLFASGEARFALGVVGFALLALFAACAGWWRRPGHVNPYAGAILIGWVGVLLVIALAPGLLNVNIPSNRVANYVPFPLAILAAFTLHMLFANVRSRKSFLIPHGLVVTGALVLGVFVFVSGMADNAGSLKETPNTQSALQTFHSAAYVNNVIGPEELFLKDHNFVVADAWIKHSFLRDYSYPLSRGFFKRYDDPTKPREQCTLWMISEPANERAQTCFDTLNVTTVLVNTEQDAPQFLRNENFSRIYQSDELSVFAR